MTTKVIPSHIVVVLFLNESGRLSCFPTRAWWFWWIRLRLCDVTVFDLVSFLGVLGGWGWRGDLWTFVGLSLKTSLDFCQTCPMLLRGRASNPPMDWRRTRKREPWYISPISFESASDSFSTPLAFDGTLWAAGSLFRRMARRGKTDSFEWRLEEPCSFEGLFWPVSGQADSVVAWKRGPH